MKKETKQKGNRMNKTKEELNKHWWHRLYKVILWTGSIFIGLYTSMGVYDYMEFIFSFLFFSIIILIVIFLTYRLVLYIALGGKVFLSNREKEYFIAGFIALLVLLAVVIGSFYFDENNRNEEFQNKIENLNLNLDL